MTPEEVDLERAAEIAACLAHFPPANRAEVVARFGLGWRDWQAVASRWAAARSAEIAAGKVEMSARFVRAFTAVASHLESGRASLESIGPLPHTFRLEATDNDDPGLDPAMPAPTVEAKQLLAGAAPIGAPPFQGGPALPAVAQAPRHLAATAGPSGVFSAPLPFAQAPASHLAATAGPSGVFRAPLPFSAALAAEALHQARAHAEAVQGPQRPAPAAGGTAIASESAAPMSLPAGLPNLTLEQYTSLRVELQLFPDRAPAVLARYGARPEAQEPLFAYWRARFEADGALRMQFTNRYAQYLAWVKQSPGAIESIAKALGAR